MGCLAWFLNVGCQHTSWYNIQDIICSITHCIRNLSIYFIAIIYDSSTHYNLIRLMKLSNSWDPVSWRQTAMENVKGAWSPNTHHGMNKAAFSIPFLVSICLLQVIVKILQRVNNTSSVLNMCNSNFLRIYKITWNSTSFTSLFGQAYQTSLFTGPVPSNNRGAFIFWGGEPINNSNLTGDRNAIYKCYLHEKMYLKLIV